MWLQSRDSDRSCRGVLGLSYKKKASEVQAEKSVLGMTRKGGREASRRLCRGGLASNLASSNKMKGERKSKHGVASGLQGWGGVGWQASGGGLQLLASQAVSAKFPRDAPPSLPACSPTLACLASSDNFFL